MMPAKNPGEVLHLEAIPKAVKRALRSVEHGLEVVECRASNAGEGEGGKTTLKYTHALDATQHASQLGALTKQASIEHDALMRDDEEDE